LSHKELNDILGIYAFQEEGAIGNGWHWKKQHQLDLEKVKKMHVGPWPKWVK
jgi:hypothetical protein